MIFLLVVLVYGQTKTSTNPSMVARPKEGNTVGSSEVKKNNIEGFRCDVLGHEHPGQVQVVQHFQHDLLAPYHGGAEGCCAPLTCQTMEGRFAVTTARTDRVMFVPETLHLAVKN